VLRLWVVFVVETSEGDDFATRRIFTPEMVHFDAFSVANVAAVSSDRDISPLPNTTL